MIPPDVRSAVALAIEALKPIAEIRSDDGDSFGKYPPAMIIRCEILVAELLRAREALAQLAALPCPSEGACICGGTMPPNDAEHQSWCPAFPEGGSMDAPIAASDPANAPSETASATSDLPAKPPQGAVTEEMVEAGACGLFEDRTDMSWERAADMKTKEHWRQMARACLTAAQAVATEQGGVKL